MLSSAYLLSVKSQPPTMDKHAIDNIAGAIVLTTVVLIVIDLIFLIYAIHCLVQCSQSQKWPVWVTVFLFILLFTPALGFAVCIGIIVYHLASGCKINHDPKTNPNLSEF